jgi:hypothetical protein
MVSKRINTLFLMSQTYKFGNCHTRKKKNEVSEYTISRTFFSIRPPKECPHERTIASSRKAPLEK